MPTKRAAVALGGIRVDERVQQRVQAVVLAYRTGLIETDAGGAGPV
jgi:hypothetical protein